MDNEFDYSWLHLTAGEYILWKGRPEKGRTFTRADLILLPFSVFWLGFSLFWEFTAIKSGAGIFMSIWGIPFVGVGIYLLFGRFIYDKIARKSTYYVITNKRLIIKRARRIKIYQGRDLPPMEVEIHSNGNGTISFYEHVHMRGNRSYTNFFSLDNIADYVGAQNAITSMED